jgi:hypothetical protein
MWKKANGEMRQKRRYEDERVMRWGGGLGVSHHPNSGPEGTPWYYAARCSDSLSMWLSKDEANTYHLWRLAIRFTSTRGTRGVIGITGLIDIPFGYAFPWTLGLERFPRYDSPLKLLHVVWGRDSVNIIAPPGCTCVRLRTKFLC